jgi:hypothetical protein
MARGTAFSELVIQLRNETGRSSDVNVGVDDLDALKQAINSVYSTLYDGNDWPHLRKSFTRIPLAAGQRYYDFPAGLNSERVEQVAVWFNDQPMIVTRGIGFEEYSLYSSIDDERSDPVTNWEVKWTGSSDQIEVWPLPSTNTQELQFIGIQAAPRLVNDVDLCLLDDTLVVLFAAAHVLGEKAGKAKLATAQDKLKLLKARGHSTPRYAVGTGGGVTAPAPTITVHISG